MFLPRRALWAAVSIAGFALVAFSQPYKSTFTLVSNSSRGRALELPSKSAHPSFASPTFQDQEMVQVMGEQEDVSGDAVALGILCNDDSCAELYPKDGKIEGKKISLLRPAGINRRGQIVGLCVLEDPDKNYAFVREPDGDIWLFKTPSSSGQGELTDIGDSGNAVGFYKKDSPKIEIGFLMNSQGKWVMDIGYPSNPCPQASPYLHTQPNGINERGEIVGNYTCTASPTDAAEAIYNGNGFYRDPDGIYFRVQYENAIRTVAGKISDTGVIVGYYVTSGDDDVWTPFAAKKEDVIKPIAP